MNKPVETVMSGGEIVRKDHARTEAYGNIDELDSFIGLSYSKAADGEIKKILFALQKDMYVIGSDLSAIKNRRKNPDIKLLEKDRLEWLVETNKNLFGSLPKLGKFIFQGGSELSASLQICRTVCRRAERRIIKLSADEDVNPVILDYLNVLSKLLFNLARLANKKAGVKEIEME